MTIEIGARLGPYQILALLGVGGMGEVYRARDTRLGRDVAIKVLPEELTRDADRRERFEREARVLAALNHPNIAAIHGVEDDGGTLALVMELVAGDTLAELLARRARRGRGLPVSESLAIAAQIAAALEAAHDKGVVHRDLKPANIKVDPAGIVKVLDFGLAKVVTAAETAAASPELTLVRGETQMGTVLGTAAYMSPEQARGLPIDQSTDAWAFGAVLYELLTGEQAFKGATFSDTVAAVIEHEPDWALLPHATPSSVRRLLQRCLHKAPNQRLRDMRAVRMLIEDAVSGADAGSTQLRQRRARRAIAWTAAAVVTVAALVLGGFAAYRGPAPPPREPIRVSITAPGPISPQLSGIISPNGKHVAFVATGPSGRSMLWLRSLDSLEPVELRGTERAAHPFWSPDSSAIGFVADAKIKRIDLPNGPVRILTDASTTWRSGGAWSRNGTILFSLDGEIAAIPDTGGTPRTVVRADPAKGERMVVWPDFLPDGRQFLFYKSSSQPEHNGVFLGSLDSPETRRILDSDIRAKYAAPGYLLHLRDDTLLAQSFDPQRLELRGEARPVADGVWFARGAYHSSFSASNDGKLAYVNITWFDRQLVWFDRNGQRVGAVGPVFRDSNGTPQLGPDGNTIAVGRGEQFRGDIWLLDATLGMSTRVTFSSEPKGVPIWSGDGRQLLYGEGRKIVRLTPADGTVETLLETDFRSVIDWSQDGRYVVLESLSDLWVVDLDGDRQPVRYSETPVNEAQAQLSMDGKWIAYTSNETGRDEVYVQSFPTPGRKRQISIEGGAMPRWTRDGKELIYLAADQTVIAVPIRDSSTLDLGAHVPLFRAPLVVWGSESGGLPTSYDVSPDGQRFLLLQPPENPPAAMTVVLDWEGALAQ